MVYTMSIADIIEELVLPGEEYVLQTKSLSLTPQEDDVGDLILEWQDVQEITGIVTNVTTNMQSQPTDPLGIQGSQENMKYVGLFEANFTIPDNGLGNYRVKHIFPSITPFIRYFEIREIDRNLRIDNELDHYEMQLYLSPKYD